MVVEEARDPLQEEEYVKTNDERRPSRDFFIGDIQSELLSLSY